MRQRPTGLCVPPSPFQMQFARGSMLLACQHAATGSKSSHPWPSSTVWSSAFLEIIPRIPIKSVNRVNVKLTNFGNSWQRQVQILGSLFATLQGESAPLPVPGVSGTLAVVTPQILVLNTESVSFSSFSKKEQGLPAGLV